MTVAAFNQSGEWAHRWVKTRWSNTRLHDESGHVLDDGWTDRSGRIEIHIPPMGWVMLAPAGW